MKHQGLPGGNTLSFTRTRIAPTPSGHLHVGNAMSFLITASLAKQAGAKLLLRIDDLDRSRTQRKYVEDIFDTLQFLGIEWQEGPKEYTDYEQRYSQMHRMHLYDEALQQLRNEELVFACHCSRTQLQNGDVCHCKEQAISFDAPSVSWRLITDDVLPLKIKNMSGDSITSLLPSSMQSFVVRKKDGLPSYQLTSLIDDEYFGVDAIARGLDLWDSTLAQQYLAMLLKKTFFQKVVFYHHPLLMSAHGIEKLSKSAGATSIQHLRSEGKTREQVLAIIRKQYDNLIIDNK